MNEKEFKEAARRGGNREGVCSATGRPCKCDAGGGCRAHRTAVDPLPGALVSRLKTLQLHLQVAKDDCDWCTDYDEFHRVWPKPEVREIRRKLETAEAILKEILG